MAELLTGHVAGHLLKRSVDYFVFKRSVDDFAQSLPSADADLVQVNIPQDVIQHIPTWGIVLLVTTVILFAFLLASVRRSRVKPP